jgi:catechol 2,3-dioxygenase-like lactoylglutathione lyase family enzyme
LAAACGATAPTAGAADPPPPEVVAVDLTVSDVGAQAAFLRALSFGVASSREIDGASRAELTLGRERVALTRYPRLGRPIPADSRADDLWFQHLAIVVSDMDAAYASLRDLGIAAISAAPQTIPRSNLAVGGIRAFYFRDVDGHPLELIWYPPSKGDPRWQARDRLFLGIDHTAITVADTERSVRFWRDLVGLAVTGESVNEGLEQAMLSGVEGARVHITGLRGSTGPGVELLDYVAPERGRREPADASPSDLWHAEIVVRVAEPSALAARLLGAGVPVTAVGDGFRADDPDGHALHVIGP